MLLKVQRVRLERGLEQAEVARLVRVAPQVLSRVETGRQVPWPALRARLAEFYGMPSGVLFEDIDAAQAFLRQQAGEVLHEPKAV